MRLDQALVARKLVASRALAQKLILNGAVTVEGAICTKTHRAVGENESLAVTQKPPFVSRGGEKLEAALRAFELEVRGLDCLDIGASTGGFTDCLLQNGAARVHCLDSGQNQLHALLRAHPKVSFQEKFNARFLTPGDLPFAPDLVVMDVSFISQTLLLGPIAEVLKSGGTLISLVKPQFELSPGDLRKDGVVKTLELQLAALKRVKVAASELGFQLRGEIESPILGGSGNREWLLFLRLG